MHISEAHSLRTAGDSLVSAGSGVVAEPRCPHVCGWMDILPQAPRCSLWPLQLAEHLPGAPGSLLDLRLCRLLTSAPIFCRIISALSQNRVAWGLLLNPAHIGKGMRTWWLSWNHDTSCQHVWLKLLGEEAPRPLCFSAALQDVRNHLLSPSVSVKIHFY